ncbi:MAG: AbrB/MazE/SpoVT family DNA-binding domain-containing protein [Chloroflexi bacterium]|nr:AbrB/MazE/SpoVT family DNA-binding domain-containing protein [Chloroflexota bacterium]
MNTTKLSSKGQIIIPKSIREEYNWQPGVEFFIVDTGDGIFLKPKTPFPATTIDEVAGCLPYDGATVSQEKMDAAIQKGVLEHWNDRS